MQKTKTWRRAAVVAMLGMAASGYAQRVPEDVLARQIVEIAQVRAQAEVACMRLRSAADGMKDGWQSTWVSLEREHSKAEDVIRAKRKVEEAKPEDARNEEVLAACEEMEAKLETIWQVTDDRRSALEAKFNESSEAGKAVNELFDHLAGAEGSMKAAGMDLSTLRPLFAATEKEAGELKASCEAAVSELKLTLESFKKQTEAEMTPAKKP